MIKYNVNEEKRTVVAYFDGEKDRHSEAMHLFKNCMSLDAYFALSRDPEDRFVDKYPDELIGKAKAAPEDTFDVEVGKRIARNRLLKKHAELWIKGLTILRDIVEEDRIQQLANINKKIAYFERQAEKFNKAGEEA